MTVEPPSDGVQLWERQRNEPNAWYDRFHAFMMAGARRSVLGVYTAEGRHDRARKGLTAAEVAAWKPKSIPPTWARIVAAWEWRERAAAYDAWLRQVELAEDEAMRREERNNRINAMRGLRGWGVRELGRLNAMNQGDERDENGQLKPKKDPDAYAVIAALKVAVQELRKEFDDEPATRHQHEGAVGNVNLDMTPGDLAGKSLPELEDEIEQFERLLRHLPRGSSARAGEAPPRGFTPDDSGGQEPPVDEP